MCASFARFSNSLTSFCFAGMPGPVHDAQPTVILRVSAMKRLMLRCVHDTTDNPPWSCKYFFADNCFRFNKHLDILVNIFIDRICF